MREKRRFAFTVAVPALAGAVVVFLLSDGLLEGAATGLIFGGSVGFISAMWHQSRSNSVSYEYEAAGLPDDNLTTIARRDIGQSGNRGNDINLSP